MRQYPKVRVAPNLLRLSRLFVVSIGLLIAVIPLSERYCRLDNFPKGQDFETNLVALLAVFGLMLLFAHICRQAFAGLLSVLARTSFFISNESQRHIDSATGSARCVTHRTPLPDPAFRATTLQLLI